MGPINWVRLGSWMLTGSLCALSIAGILSIGVFIAPVAALMFIVSLNLDGRAHGSDDASPAAFMAGVAWMVGLFAGGYWLSDLRLDDCGPNSDPGCAESATEWIGFGVGMLCLAAGVALLLRFRRQVCAQARGTQPPPSPSFVG